MKEYRLTVDRDGMSLSFISNKYYGSLFYWPQIYEYSKGTIGPDPDIVKKGTTIYLPPAMNEKLVTTQGLKQVSIFGPSIDDMGPAIQKVDITEPLMITAPVKKAGFPWWQIGLVGAVGAALMYFSAKGK